VLIHNGKLFQDVMERSKLTHHELHAALRQAGCTCVEEVRSAILENNGAISVVVGRHPEASHHSGAQGQQAGAIGQNPQASGRHPEAAD
jgi:uncharacterized membrane protein YcaP (DUF421 family)